MSAATPPLARRIYQAILAVFDRDALVAALYLDLQQRFTTLVADKNFGAQLLELLDTLDQEGRVPELLRCLSASRPDNEDLAALTAEAEQRQAQVGPGRPILGRTQPPATVPQPPRAVPLQKPLRTPHFIGRAAELAKLLADLQPGKVATLWGPGGMGKTALAAEAIWTLSPGEEPPARFPDGIIFHTFYHQPQANLALEKIALAYGVDPRPTPRDAALQALSGKTALLVLDGAEQADDLPAVLAVAGSCAVLITTRLHTDAPADLQDIAPLPRAESLDLLRAWAGSYAAADTAANDIVRLLGGLPLALYLCGRYLAQRHQQAAEYVTWLQEEGLEALHFGDRPSRSIPLLLRRSLDQVSTQAQAAFGAAGILALAPFDAAPIAAALGVKPTTANRALGELVDYGLLLRPDESYQVTHALAHTYARTQAAPGAGAVNRLAMYYAALAKTESAKGLPGYSALNSQRAHIVAVQAAAFKAKQWYAVRQITWNVENYLDLRGYFTDRMNVLRGGIAAAGASDARFDEREFTNRLGHAFKDSGQPRDAIEFYERALAISREIGNRPGEGNALGSLGLAFAALGETRRAIELYEQGLVITREIGDRRNEGVALGNLGLAYAALGETRRAIELYEQELVIMREIGYRRGEGAALGSLGIAYKDLGETRGAIELYEKRLLIAREIGDRRGEGNALGNMGVAFAVLGETRRAIDLYEQQLVIAREIGDRRSEGSALGNIGRALADAGDTDLAITRCRESLAIKQETGDRTGEGEALNYLGYAYHAAGSYPQAADFHCQAVDILTETSAIEPLSIALTDLAETHLACGEYGAAAVAAERAAQIATEHGFRTRLAAALWAQARAQDGLSERPQAVDLAQQALAICSTLDEAKAGTIQAQLAAWQHT